jgi:predicted  nucleic acid-binding Zn-ribbon protein
VKIRGTCTNCGREFLQDQVIESGGHCPWCGKPFSADYTSLVIQALRQADEAGDALEGALKELASVDPSMEIDEETVLGPIREALRSLRHRRSRV